MAMGRRGTKIRGSRLAAVALAIGWVASCSEDSHDTYIFNNGGVAGASGSAGSSGSAGKGGGAQGGSSSGGTSGGEPNAGAAGTGEGGESGAAGMPSGGAGGSGSAGDGGESSDGGEGGVAGDLPLAGAIVVAQRVGNGTQAVNSLIVIDPADGSEVDRIETELMIHAVGYEAARDKWFVFTGTTGAGGASTVLVGSVSRAGFVVEGMTVVPDGKPTGPSTTVVLNRRIVYRTVQSDGIDSPDTVVLLDTSNLSALTILGSVDVPPDKRIFSAFGRPSAGATPGGRVTYIHFNRASSPVSGCVASDAGTDTVCPVRTSTTLIGAGAVSPPMPPTPAFVDWISQSGSNASGAASWVNDLDYIVVPPVRAEGSSATVFAFDATSAKQAEKSFDLGPLGAPNDSVSISAAVADPCAERVVAAEQANTRALYAISMQGSQPAASVALDTPGGGLAYEPHTKAVIQFFPDPTNPSFRAFTLGGTAEAPNLVERSASAWTPPTNLNPALVVVKSPLTPPCD